MKSFFNTPDNQLVQTPGAFKTIASNYNDAFWFMVYRGVWRISAIWPVVLIFILAMGVPSMIDGLVTRAKKASDFGNHNPVYFWTASQSLILVMGLSFFLPFIPIAFTPTLFLGFTAAMCISLWVTASNFQTGN